MPEADKNIDESWKEAVDKEKAKAQGAPGKDNFVPPEPDFSFFITTLAFQASIFLGDMPNPANNQKEQNLPQAKFMIDTLKMLKDKTAGNLSAEEDGLLDNALYDLRMRYIAKAQEKKTQGGTT